MSSYVGQFGRVARAMLTRLPIVLLIALSNDAFGEQTSSGQPLPLKRPGIKRLYRVSDRIFSGGQPNGVTAFRSLQKLGVKTILSVDGARPDVETARRFGLRYVHLPIGYDGVDRVRALRIVKAVKDLPGPVFIHCHQGRHRGPAAVGLAAIALEDWANQRAVDWLHLAGTSGKYRGLFDSTRNFSPPTAQQLAKVPSDFPERAEVSSLVERMVAIDRCFEDLQEIRAAGFRAPKNHPDLDPAASALLLWEHFRELSRTERREKWDEDFAALVRESEQSAAALYAALEQLAETRPSGPIQGAQTHFQNVAQMCTTCHERYRDRPVNGR